MLEHHVIFHKPPRAVRMAGALPGTEPVGGQPHAAVHSAAPTDTPQTLAAIELLQSNLYEAVAELEMRRQSALGEMQAAAVELAVAVASHILHEKITADDFAVENLVQQAVERLQNHAPLSVRLHPEDLALLQRRIADRAPPWQADGQVRLVADATLARGDCRADAGDFGVLAGIERQLTEIRQHLLESLDHAQTERREASKSDQSLRRFPDRRETA